MQLVVGILWYLSYGKMFLVTLLQTIQLLQFYLHCTARAWINVSVNNSTTLRRGVDVLGETTPWHSSNETESATNANHTNLTDTQTVTADTAAPPTCHWSYFDFGSFIGGLVFACGSVAILCFTRLLFQSRSEDRYHVL